MSLALTRLYQLEPDPRYRDAVIATLDFVLAEMRHPQGAFFSALDASSERPDQAGTNAEGAYYLWRAADIRAALNKDEWDLARPYFDIQDGGNIESDPRGEFEKLNILHVSDDYTDRGLTEAQQSLLASAKRKLHEARSKRPRPHLDDKIITAWNGMMIRAPVEAGAVFDQKRYLDAAATAAVFIKNHLLDKDSQMLLRRMREEQAGIDAGLVDYAWYVNGLLALYAETRDRQWLRQAQQLTAKQVGRLFRVGSGHEYTVSHALSLRRRAAGTQRDRAGKPLQAGRFRGRGPVAAHGGQDPGFVCGVDQQRSRFCGLDTVNRKQ